MNKKKFYITITGTRNYYGTKIFEKEMILNLIKEPTNDYDKEAIMVKLLGLGTVGYVANSVYCVIGECSSAGRIYDKFDNETTAKVAYVLEQGVICEVEFDV